MTILRARVSVLLAVGTLLVAAGCADSTGPDDPAGDDAPEGLTYGVERTRLGAETDVAPSLHGPSLLLQGDGAPLEAAVQAHAERVSDQPLDVVVLAASFPSGGSPTPECDRMGRLITFVGRQMGATEAASFSGLGVNEGTAVVVDSAEMGTVHGGRAYLVHGDHPPETMAPDTALTYTDVQIVQLSAGTTYDLAERPLDRAYTRSVEAGTLSANPYRPEAAARGGSRIVGSEQSRTQ